MKKKIIIITISLIVIFILGMYFSTISNAAIEIKSGTIPHTNIKVTDSYQYCYDMRSSTSTLGNNSLDPHLTLNADWAAVAYLGASTYGSVRDADGYNVTIGEISHNSTTNNITGVMDMGKTTSTQTASLLEGYTANFYRTNLENNANTKYVEILGAETIEATKGKGFVETKGWWESLKQYNTSTSFPIAIRRGILGYYTGSSQTTNPGKAAYGNAVEDTTYRPVIWN